MKTYILYYKHRECELEESFIVSAYNFKEALERFKKVHKTELFKFIRGEEINL